jgi:hypothetical protein
MSWLAGSRRNSVAAAYGGHAVSMGSAAAQKRRRTLRASIRVLDMVVAVVVEKADGAYAALNDGARIR